MALRPSERSAVNNEPVWYPECRRLSRQGGPLGRASICTLGASVAQRPPRERDCRWSPFHLNETKNTGTAEAKFFDSGGLTLCLKISVFL